MRGPVLVIIPCGAVNIVAASLISAIITPDMGPTLVQRLRICGVPEEDKVNATGSRDRVVLAEEVYSNQACLVDILLFDCLVLDILMIDN